MSGWLLVTVYLLAGILVGVGFWFFMEEYRIPLSMVLLAAVLWPVVATGGILFLFVSIAMFLGSVELPPSPLSEIKARRAAIGKERARIRALQDEAELRRLQKARHDLERELQVP